MNTCRDDIQFVSIAIELGWQALYFKDSENTKRIPSYSSKKNFRG